MECPLPGVAKIVFPGFPVMGISRLKFTVGESEHKAAERMGLPSLNGTFRNSSYTDCESKKGDEVYVQICGRIHANLTMNDKGATTDAVLNSLYKVDLETAQKEQRAAEKALMEVSEAKKCIESELRAMAKRNKKLEDELKDAPKAKHATSNNVSGLAEANDATIKALRETIAAKDEIIALHKEIQNMLKHDNKPQATIIASQTTVTDTEHLKSVQDAVVAETKSKKSANDAPEAGANQAPKAADKDVPKADAKDAPKMDVKEPPEIPVSSQDALAAQSNGESSNQNSIWPHARRIRTGVVDPPHGRPTAFHYGNRHRPSDIPSIYQSRYQSNSLMRDPATRKIMAFLQEYMPAKNTCMWPNEWERMEAIEHHFTSLGTKPMSIDDIPGVFKYGPVFKKWDIPDHSHKRFIDLYGSAHPVRMVWIRDVPPRFTVLDVLDFVKGGQIVSAMLVTEPFEDRPIGPPTDAIWTQWKTGQAQTAIVIFVEQASMLTYFYAAKKWLKAPAATKCNAWQGDDYVRPAFEVSIPDAWETYPTNDRIMTAIQNGATRCISIANFPKFLQERLFNDLRLTEAERFRVHYGRSFSPMDNSKSFSTIHLEFSSVERAVQARQTIHWKSTYNRWRYEIEFAPDPCSAHVRHLGDRHPPRYSRAFEWLQTGRGEDIMPKVEPGGRWDEEEPEETAAKTESITANHDDKLTAPKNIEKAEDLQKDTEPVRPEAEIYIDLGKETNSTGGSPLKSNDTATPQNGDSATKKQVTFDESSVPDALIGQSDAFWDEMKFLFSTQHGVHCLVDAVKEEFPLIGTIANSLRRKVECQNCADGLPCYMTGRRHYVKPREQLKAWEKKLMKNPLFNGPHFTNKYLWELFPLKEEKADKEKAVVAGEKEETDVYASSEVGVPTPASPPVTCPEKAEEGGVEAKKEKQD